MIPAPLSQHTRAHERPRPQHIPGLSDAGKRAWNSLPICANRSVDVPGKPWRGCEKEGGTHRLVPSVERELKVH